MQTESLSASRFIPKVASSFRSSASIRIRRRFAFSCGDGPVYGLLAKGAHTLDRRGTVDAMKNGQVR